MNESAISAGAPHEAEGESTPAFTPLPSAPPVMEDFVFGGIEADPQARLAAELARWTGLRHFHQIDPRDPQPGQPVTVTVYAGPDAQADRVTLYATVDGGDPTGRRGVAAIGFAIPLQRVEVRWAPLLWDFVTVWQGEIPAQPDEAMVHYRVEGWCSYDERVSLWSRESNLDRTPELPARYGYHVDTLAPPPWAHEAVVYHIFVDRFAAGGPADGDGSPSPLPRRWLAPAELHSFAGGNLRGVIERLDYISSLGATAIWLSPIFRTPSYHGYDTTDFYTVDPRFGANDDLRALVEAAHARNLRVILDFVANHTSTAFAPFAEAQRNAASPYRAWFSFDPAYKHGYRAFFDVAEMPQLNTDHPAVRRYLIDAARHWLMEYGVDGYRLDYAAGPSHAFWSEFRAACRQARPDCWLFGEVTLAGDPLRAYTGRLDGCLDFALCRLLRQLCAGPQPAISLAHFANAVAHSHAFFGDLLLLSFLDNHDMNRFLWMAGNDKTRLRLAVALLFALGGPPVIYYGTEVGLSQPRGKGPWREEARHPMLWGDAQDGDLRAFFQTWIAARRRHPALQRGQPVTRHLDEEMGTWLVERQHGADRVLIAVNTHDAPAAIPLPPGRFVDLAGRAAQDVLNLEGRSVALLVP